MASAPAIPPELKRLMAEIGPRWREDATNNVKLMVEKFSELLRQAPKDGVRVTPNIPYGTHARQQLDLFQPAGGSGKRPALVFVHGGAFTDGDRNRSPEIYANVPSFFA